MTAEKQATPYADLVRFRSELPEHVLDAALKIKALGISAPTDEENCAYCQSVLDGDPAAGLKTCRHYDRVGEVYKIIFEEVKSSLTKEEIDLLQEDDRVEYSASSAKEYARKEASIAMGIPEGYLVRNLWEALPEGYYAVADPRADVEEMTYWRRSEGKRGPAFKAWPNKARYGPRLTWDDLPAPRDKYYEENQWFMRAWHEIVGEPYRDAIVETLMEDPIAAQHRFADFNTRCCSCGKKLTNDISKVYGIGPECRRSIPTEILANYYRPDIGRAHALVTNSK